MINKSLADCYMASFTVYYQHKGVKNKFLLFFGGFV